MADSDDSTQFRMVMDAFNGDSEPTVDCTDCGGAEIVRGEHKGVPTLECATCGDIKVRDLSN